MEQSGMGSSQYCFGCLCAKEEKTVYCLILRNSALKTVLQAECLFLCYLCKRASQQAELFIQNVQSNQILLENIHSIEDSTLHSARVLSRPPHQLSLKSLETIELGADSSQEYLDVKQKELNPTRELPVKQELKEEGGRDDYDDDHIDNDFQEPCVKEEDFSLNALLKDDYEMVEVDIKSLKKTLKKGKYTKRKFKKDVEIKREDEDICDIETVHITREQCLEERARMARDDRFLASAYKCQHCIKGFNYKESFDKHMEKHMESNGDYECDICKQRMRTEEKLISHKRYHEVRYRCPVCGLTRVSRLTVKDHYSAFHTANHYRHSCPHCAKSFKRQVSWRKHISNVHTRKRVTCAYCNKTYANKDVLKAHMVVRHPKEVSAGEVTKSHICSDCGKAFKAPSQLKIHSIKHSINRDYYCVECDKIPTKSHICSDCGKAFKAPSQLKIHSFKHSINRDYYCVECDKSFKSASILKHHLKTASTHVSYIELPLPCEHCDKRFAIRRDLERHTNRVHLNIKPFQCDRCEKAYVNAWSLNEHRRLTHEGFKRPLKYPCPMCDKVFDRNQVLKGHIRTHTGERPYQCSRCPAQFSQASILGTHVKLIHLKLTRDGRPKALATK